MLGTSPQPEGITNPPIDDLLEKVDSKYGLVVEAAKRARQINTNIRQREENRFEFFPPLVDTEPEEKPLSTALREVAADKLQVISGEDARARGGRAGADGRHDGVCCGGGQVGGLTQVGGQQAGGSGAGQGR